MRQKYTGSVHHRQRLHKAIRVVIVMSLFFPVVSFVYGGGMMSSSTLKVKGDILHVHDPSIIKDKNTYYLFTTGNNIPVRYSTDLIHWKSGGTVFDRMPDWASKDLPLADNIWAPDISYFNGKYHLYYAVSTFGSNYSYIGLATNQTLDPKSTEFHWVDEGEVIGSLPSDNWNAIDPNIVIDAAGSPWLAFGSFWSGLKIIKIDQTTGKPYRNERKIISIASRLKPPNAIEASFIVYRDGYYYLFASFDFCCRGVNSTYKIRVGRSKNVTGPYVDQEGTSLMKGGGTLLAESTERWRGPGGESILHDTNGKWWIVYHSYDAELSGMPVLRISRLIWNSKGWPLPVTSLSSSIQ